MKTIEYFLFISKVQTHDPLEKGHNEPGGYYLNEHGKGLPAYKYWLMAIAHLQPIFQMS